MPVMSLMHKPSALLVALPFVTLLGTPRELRAQHLEVDPSLSSELHSIKVVDVFNLFPNVGSLIYLVEPNDVGVPAGIISHCTGTVIHERLFLVAGHCQGETNWLIRIRDTILKRLSGDPSAIDDLKETAPGGSTA